MEKFFNIAGPCQPDLHYMLPAQQRCQGLDRLIEQAQYFIIHAARQSGKTTLLLDLTKQLNQAGDYYALYCSLETVQGIVEPERGIPAIISCIQFNIEMTLNVQFDIEAIADNFNTALLRFLTKNCKKLDKPLIILFDEVDCLANGTLISFLRQLRDGYVNRQHIPFVHSIALVGMRNIRDYKNQVREVNQTLGSASPFNIVTESLSLRNFSLDEVSTLYTLHSEQTGQKFSSEVTQAIYDSTQGQPWLINAIAREVIVKILNNDYSKTIELTHIEQAITTIIKRRDTHIDSLMERLKEPRVQRVIEPIILGVNSGYDLLDDDYQYVFDLGLVREHKHQLIPANPIYAEVIIRTLSFRSQCSFAADAAIPQTPAYIKEDKLDMQKLLSDFQKFWRINSESWIARYQYQEAAPHLILQAYLQRIINDGGSVSREMAAGNGRLDLCLHYLGIDYPVELKIRYSDETYQQGKDQLALYLDKLGCREGWLVVFDRRKTVSWEDKLFWQTHQVGKKVLYIVGC